MEKGFSIGYMVGYFLSKVLGGFAKLLWKGIVTASQHNKPLLFTYVGLIGITFLMYIGTGHIGSMPLIIIIIAIIFGILENRKDAPLRNREKYFKTVFEEIGLFENNRETPDYLEEKDISEYAKEYIFYTLLPISEWLKFKEKLETYWNVKIIEMKQREGSYRVIRIITQSRSLPEKIEFSTGYMDLKVNILNVGMGYYGIVGINLAKNPHVFIAGETGSGKSNILKCLIYQAIIKDYDITLIDFKRGVTFNEFAETVSVCYEHVEALKVLNNLVMETNRRLDLFRGLKVDGIEAYNRISKQRLHRKIVFIDELAELLKIRYKEISHKLYDNIETLTRISRSAGVHLIMGIQRPDSTVITGQIKSNVSCRICGRFVDKEPSRIMLGTDMASTLPNIKGRFIVKGEDIQEVQTFYYKDKLNTSENTAFHENKIEYKLLEDKTGKKEVREEKQETLLDLDFDFSDLDK